MKRLVVFCLTVILVSCSNGGSSQNRAKQYQLAGKVVALDPEHKIATVDAQAIPGFMEAMTMEYPVHSQSEFSGLHVNDSIAATVNVNGDGQYSLSNIKARPAGK